jgi:hypothetical protein
VWRRGLDFPSHAAAPGVNGIGLPHADQLRVVAVGGYQPVG